MLKQAEKSITDLKRRSKEISPLKLRRTRPSEPLSLDTLCDWDAGEVRAGLAAPSEGAESWILVWLLHILAPWCEELF